MNPQSPTFLLRLILSIILLSHSIPAILDGGVYGFGEMYLNKVGFAPVGVPLAWAIKLSHIACAVCLLFEAYVPKKVNVSFIIITISVFMAGIFMVHLENGWFVVGGGRNGVEYNVLLIFVLTTLLFPEGLKKGK